MRIPKTKKIFSLMEEQLISAILRDISQVEKKTESEVVEAILLGLRPPLLPGHPLASEYVATLYTNLDNPMALKETYRKLFAYVAASVDGHMRISNLLPVVELLRDMAWTKDNEYEKKPNAWTHCKVQWNSILDYMTHNDLTNLKENSFEWFDCKRNIDYGKDLYDTMERFPDEFSLIANMLNYVVECWNSIHSYDRTYRLLVDIADLICPANTAENRRAFSNCLYTISQSWDNKV